MSEHDDGGPAFPRDHRHDGHNGLSLRDYFAAKAIAGMLMAGDVGGDYVGHMECGDWTTLSKHAYKLADAMLKARSA